LSVNIQTTDGVAVLIKIKTGGEVVFAFSVIELAKNVLIRSTRKIKAKCVHARSFSKEARESQELWGHPMPIMMASQD